VSEFLSMRKRIRPAWLLVVGFTAFIALSLFFEGPRSVYAHAILICLDCIGLV
jgi:hypothetical protein